MQRQGSEVEGQSTAGADLEARVAERRLGTKFGRMGKAQLTGKKKPEGRQTGWSNTGRVWKSFWAALKGEQVCHTTLPNHSFG